MNWTISRKQIAVNFWESGRHCINKMFLETRKNNTTICLPWRNLPAFSVKQSFTTYLFCLTHSFPSWTCLSQPFFPSRKQKHPCVMCNTYFFCLKNIFSDIDYCKVFSFICLYTAACVLHLKHSHCWNGQFAFTFFFIGKHNTIHSTDGQLFNVIPKFVELK